VTLINFEDKEVKNLGSFPLCKEKLKAY